ncbi:metal-sulfur cluster biosynthetic enzyme [Lactobacillus colini]|uniref:Metal-sulfur cluster biosynthetic enzyme n=1 Tax=Lactobacillus colini TaxID=1819254 RepID=A0ABS4MCN8_9LACO|nr:iron-sulfur cluster assembly protein [Lactobacillus colini]MBP2057434.1 metal-sulfur cluster biosynthetic enzyme [Lactobacillus colini]
MEENKLKLVDQIMTALQGVEDPEIQVDVVNLGLIYGIDIEGSHATVKMTLTISGCPLSSLLQNSIQNAVLSVPGIDKCDVKLVWYPVWSPDKMTTAAKRQLGMLEDEQEIAQKQGIESIEKVQKIIDFSLPIKKLAEEYPDFVQIMYDAGFTRIKIPGLLATVGRVMTIPLGAQAMKLDLGQIKKAFEDKGYKVIE